MFVSSYQSKGRGKETFERWPLRYPALHHQTDEGKFTTDLQPYIKQTRHQKISELLCCWCYLKTHLWTVQCFINFFRFQCWHESSLLCRCIRALIKSSMCSTSTRMTLRACVGWSLISTNTSTWSQVRLWHHHPSIQLHLFIIFNSPPWHWQ